MNRRLVSLLIASSLVLASCETEDMELARAFIEQWALDHAVEVAVASSGFPSGDPYVDAAVDAGKPIKDMMEGDIKMAEGRKNDDPAAMDAALALRPNDWTYQLSRANLALQQGDMATYDRFMTAAEGGSPLATGAFYAQDYGELFKVNHRLRDAGNNGVGAFGSYDQCTRLYSRLLFLARRNDPPGSNRDLGLWMDRLAECETMPVR